MSSPLDSLRSIGAAVLLTASVLANASLNVGCIPGCNDTNKTCPAPGPGAPANSKPNLATILGGLNNGGSGEGTAKIPYLGDTTVGLSTAAGGISPPAAGANGATTSTINASFSKAFGLVSGNAKVDISSSPDGTGSMSWSGTATIAKKDFPLNDSLSLSNGSTTGNTTTYSYAHGKDCGTVTITRTGQTITLTTDNPKTSVTYTGN